MWALPPPLPSPRIAELIGVVSERAQLKECVRDDAEHRDDKREHNECEECVHRPPSLGVTLGNTDKAVIGGFAELRGQNY